MLVFYFTRKKENRTIFLFVFADCKPKCPFFFFALIRPAPCLMRSSQFKCLLFLVDGLSFFGLMPLLLSDIFAI